MEFINFFRDKKFKGYSRGRGSVLIYPAANIGNFDHLDVRRTGLNSWQFFYNDIETDKTWERCPQTVGEYRRHWTGHDTVIFSGDRYTDDLEKLCQIYGITFFKIPKPFAFKLSF